MRAKEAKALIIEACSSKSGTSVAAALYEKALALSRKREIAAQVGGRPSRR